MQPAPHVAAAVQRVAQRRHSRRLVGAQPQARHAAAERGPRVGRRGQQQVVALRGLRVADERVHVGGGQVGGQVGRQAPARADLGGGLGAPRALGALCRR